MASSPALREPHLENRTRPMPKRTVTSLGILLLALVAVALWHSENGGGSHKGAVRLAPDHGLQDGVIALACETNVVIWKIGQPRQTGKMRIASLSKPLTALAVMALNNREPLLDKPYHPRNDGEPTAGKPTARELLQHSAGLPAAGPGDPLFLDGLGQEIAGCEAALARTAAAVTAGQKGVASYSNLGYCMLGELIREKTEKPYPDAVRDLLGIDKRDFALPTEDTPNGYGARGVGFDDTDVASLGPAGGWAASPAAYARLLARRDMADLRSAPLTTTADGVRWTLGFSVWDRPEGRYLTHLGDLEGVFSLALVSPRRTAAVAVFEQRVPDLGRAANAFFPALARDLEEFESFSCQRRPAAPSPAGDA